MTIRFCLCLIPESRVSDAAIVVRMSVFRIQPDRFGEVADRRGVVVVVTVREATV